MSTSRYVLTPLIGLACAVAFAATTIAGQQPAPPTPAPIPNDLDAFMAKVLEKRNENWRTLHDYILSEREVFEVIGPLGFPLHSLRREFQWFVKEGYLVRSPVKSNGVALSAAERTKYEDRWLKDEKEREEKARKKQAKEDERREVQLTVSVTGDMQLSGMASQGSEPRFISEAYFMRFKFEPGNYYFAGREQLDEREVLKVEYLPANLFNDSKKSRDTDAAAATDPKPGSKPEPRAEPQAAGAAGAKAEPKAGGKAGAKTGRKRDAKEQDDEEKLERAMNKTSMVTMWIDPQEYQIVRFTFDNVDWGFLPGRQVVRIDETRASMTMGRVFEHIWLPRDVTFTGAATFAPGTLRFTFRREFYDYRRGEVSAKIRAYVPKEPQS